MTEITAEAASWLAKVRNLAPAVEQWRDEGERERRMPQPIFDAMRDDDFFRMRVPQRYGGHAVQDETFVRCVEELSRLDGAVGWILSIAGAGGVFSPYLTEAGALPLFGPPQKGAGAGSVIVSGRAVRVPGGFRISGRWPFASGCSRASWIFVASRVFDGDAPATRPDGAPEIRLAFLGSTDCEILDTWYSEGLRGTGSHDVQVTDAFVSDEATFAYSDLLSGATKEDCGPLYARPFPQLAGPGHAAVALGIARDAIDSFKALIASKTPFGGRSTLASYHTVHDAMGRAEALVSAGRAYLFETVKRLNLRESQSIEEEVQLTALALLASSHAAQSASQAVDLLYDAAGGTSVYARSRLERCFRDVHTVTHHVTLQSMNYQTVGQYLLGLGFELRK